MGFKPLDFSINDITAWTKASLGIWPMTPLHGVTLSGISQRRYQSQTDDHASYRPVEWREGFDAMVDKTAIKVIMTTTLMNNYSPEGTLSHGTDNKPHCGARLDRLPDCRWHSSMLPSSRLACLSAGVMPLVA